MNEWIKHVMPTEFKIICSEFFPNGLSYISLNEGIAPSSLNEGITPSTVSYSQNIPFPRHSILLVHLFTLLQLMRKLFLSGLPLSPSV